MPISAIMIRALLAASEEFGCTAAKVLLAAGLDPHEGDDPSSMLGDHDVSSLVGALSSHARETLLGVKLGKRCGEHSLHLFGQVLLACPSLRDAATVWEELGPVLIGGPTVRLTIAGERARLQLEHSAELDPPSARLLAEFTLSLLCGMALRFAGTAAALVQSVEFKQPLPFNADSNLRVHGVATYFGRAADAVSFAPALLDRPLPGTYPGLVHTMRGLAQQELVAPRTDRSWTARIRAVLKRSPDLAHVDFEIIARDARITLRTLRRRIHAEGTTLGDLLDHVRAERATNQLESPQASINVVAEQLGYSESSSFHRAFKRWTGMTPSAYRKRAHLSAHSA